MQCYTLLLVSVMLLYNKDLGNSACIWTTSTHPQVLIDIKVLHASWAIQVLWPFDMTELCWQGESPWEICSKSCLPCISSWAVSGCGASIHQLYTKIYGDYKGTACSVLVPLIAQSPKDVCKARHVFVYLPIHMSACLCIWWWLDQIIKLCSPMGKVQGCAVWNIF